MQILFLNKEDLFRERIQHSPIRKFFPVRYVLPPPLIFWAFGCGILTKSRDRRLLGLLPSTHTHTPLHRTMTDQKTMRTRGCSTSADDLCSSPKRRIRCSRRRNLAMANGTSHHPSTRDEYTPSESNPIQPNPSYPLPFGPPSASFSFYAPLQTGTRRLISLTLITLQFHERR